MQPQDSRPLLPTEAVIPPGIAMQIRQAGEAGKDGELLLQQQELKAKAREENAAKALAKSHELSSSVDLLWVCALLSLPLVNVMR